MTTEAGSRERLSDAAREPLFWYVYIERMDDGKLYVGQTNNILARHIEHSIDAGARATSGQGNTLVFVAPVLDRGMARNFERRLQAALDRSPMDVEAQIQEFREVMDMLRPPKSLRQLEKDQRAFDSRMRKAFHYWPSRLSLGPNRWKAHCGWDGDEIYGTERLEAFRQRCREADALASVGGSYPGRQPCADCRALL